MNPFLRVGIAGLGTVGAGVVRLLRQNAELIAARAGRPIEIVAVSARDRGRDRGIELSGPAWHDDPTTLATAPGIDVVAELIGGAGDPALGLVTAALRAGRPVVSANKALLALHGPALARAAPGATLAFEAAVAGGIPIIKALREGLAGNRILRVAGILNGTSNYILTTMRERGRDFAPVLEEAQRLGYAESDPSFDIDGIDTAHKLAILAALAFGPVDFASIHVEGIRGVSALDHSFARELGYRIKLLGIARATDTPSGPGVEARVHPCLVPDAAPLARVDGVYNAIVVETDAAGRLMLEGRGAGAGPTASAVVADLVDIARGRTAPLWDGQAPCLTAPISSCTGAYYLRLMVVDRAGVIADVTAALRDAGVSLESMLQHGRSPGETVPIVLVTHETRERDMRAALDRIERLDAVLERPSLIRIEHG